MAKPKYEMHVCTEEGCKSLGKTTDPVRAAKRVDREVKRLAKRKIRGRPRAGVVKGSVVDEQGAVQYRAHEEFGAPDSPPRSRPRRRRELSYGPPLPPIGEE